MISQFSHKSSIQEIKQRFDNDVERFTNLETGQQATVDATISLELITDAAKCITPAAQNILDIGCGAGNYTLKMLTKLPDLNCTLIDLSSPMLEKAKERVGNKTVGNVQTIQSDIKEVALLKEHYDIILAGAVLHHLRADDEWLSVFRKLYLSLKKGGSLWISDLIIHDNPSINQLVWAKYGAYLQELRGEAYKENVFAYIEKEYTPRSLNYQLKLLAEVGFKEVEVLHKNSCFAAFGGIKI